MRMDGIVSGRAQCSPPSTTPGTNLNKVLSEIYDILADLEGTLYSVDCLVHGPVLTAEKNVRSDVIVGDVAGTLAGYEGRLLLILGTLSGINSTLIEQLDGRSIITR